VREVIQTSAEEAGAVAAVGGSVVLLGVGIVLGLKLLSSRRG